MLVLIRVQTVCKGNQQTTKVATMKELVKGLTDHLVQFFFFDLLNYYKLIYFNSMCMLGNMK